MRLVYKKSWKIQQCWLRVGQCGCHKTDYKPTLREIRGRVAEKKKSSKELSKAF